MVGFDDTAGNGQAKADAGIASRIERFSGAAGGFRSKATAGIADFDDQLCFAIGCRGSVN